MDREVFVYIDLQGEPILVGRLWSRIRKGRESATFEYVPSWLAHPERFALEPALTLAPGPFPPSGSCGWRASTRRFRRSARSAGLRCGSSPSLPRDGGRSGYPEVQVIKAIEIRSRLIPYML
jgi:hypothetical protein